MTRTASTCCGGQGQDQKKQEKWGQEPLTTMTIWRRRRRFRRRRRTHLEKKQKIRHGINGQTPGDQWRWHLKCGVGIIRPGPINPCSSQQDALTFPENKTSICLIARMTRPGSTLCTRHDANQGCIKLYKHICHICENEKNTSYLKSSDALGNKHL